MNRPHAVLIAAFGLMAGMCVSARAGEIIGATALKSARHPAANPAFATKVVRYPVVSIATRVVTLPRSDIATLEARSRRILPVEVHTYAVRSPEAGAVSPLMAARQPGELLRPLRRAAGYGPAAVPVRRDNANAEIASPFQAAQKPDEPAGQ